MKKLLSLLAFSTWMLPLAARAEDVGLAKPWQLNFQAPATPVMAQLNTMHDYLLWLITAISVFVLLLIVYIVIKFNRKANPVPSKVTHNTKLEIIWTTIPVIILIAIAIPSLKLHYFMEKNPNPDMTIKIVGYQWFWHYDYPDQGGFGFDSYIVKDKDLKPTDHRLLAVDNRLVVPVDTNIRVQLTGADVIHAWAVPAFGVKRDAIPGRLNETWFKAEKTGTYYGQCSELCGVGHGFMPIVVDVVSKEEFATWVKAKQKEAGLPENPAPAANQKVSTPITPAVSSEHKDPAPVIEKEKALSKPTATDSSKKQAAPGDTHIGNQNQPAPAKAAGEAVKE